MSTQDAANGFVSGELLLRSDENDDRCLLGSELYGSTEAEAEHAADK